MPRYTVDLLQDELNKLAMPVKNTKVGVLGLAYKANIDDTRESPSFKIIKTLKDLEAEVITYDPYLKEKSTVSSLKEILTKTDALILATDHQEFINNLDGATLKKYQIKAVVDGKNCLNKEDILAAGVAYKGIGH
jgi:UDP-N-acetyl-D-mannosaminuronate dehydrogenase